jgi:hypothetical protein
MKEVKFMVPTLEELNRDGPDKLQEKMMTKEYSEELAKDGVAVYFTTDSTSFSPDGKTAVFSVYVVLGLEEDLKNTLKYYYTQE